jgi:hypothetical protein|uniref:Uncharacterized protein n=1 Tax=viral metagenome TaxID=1070528 RepID=A0A6C0BET1_9ZZZZ
MYGVIIVLFVILLVLVAVMHTWKVSKEAFNEYQHLFSNMIPDRNSCIKILEEKGWFNPNDTSLKNKERKSIIADFETTRVAQPLYSSVIFPHVEACTIANDVIDLYNNNRGVNIIDKDTCVMKGNTVDNKLVYHKMTPVESSSVYHPKGCMIELDKMNKKEFYNLIDDAYQLKMYPELLEKKEYKVALIELTKKKERMQQQYNHLLELGRAGKFVDWWKARRTNKSTTSWEGGDCDAGDDSLEIGMTASCKDKYTAWNDANQWQYNYMDRHNMQCDSGEVISGIQLETRYRPNRMRYKYRCCKMDTTPIPGKIQNRNNTGYTAWRPAYNWNAIGLTQHRIECPNNGLLNEVEMKSQDNGFNDRKTRYNYGCAEPHYTGIDKKKIDLSCRQVKSKSITNAPSFDAINQLPLKCEDGEGLSSFGLQTDGNQMFYQYSCCRPNVVPN